MNQYLSLFYKTPIIALVAITRCTQLGTSNAEIKKDIQAETTDHIEVKDLQVEERENVGTKVNPNVQARFKVLVEMKEETFRNSFKANSSVETRKHQEAVTFKRRRY